MKTMNRIAIPAIAVAALAALVMTGCGGTPEVSPAVERDCDMHVAAVVQDYQRSIEAWPREGLPYWQLATTQRAKCHAEAEAWRARMRALLAQ